MKTAKFISLLGVFLLTSASSAMAAETNISVKSTGNSEVKVNSNVQSSSTNSNSTTNSNTHVVTEVNGVRKEYTAKNGESINVDEEGVKVNINNINDSKNTTTEEIKKEVEQKVKGVQTEVGKKAKEKKNEVQQELEKKIDQKKEEQKQNISQRIKSFFDGLKAKFFN